MIFSLPNFRRDLALISDLITEDNLKRNENYEITDLLNHAGIKSLLESVLDKYLEKVGIEGRKLTPEENQELKGCGISAYCDPDEECINDSNDPEGYKCLKGKVVCVFLTFRMPILKNHFTSTRV